MTVSGAMGGFGNRDRSTGTSDGRLVLGRARPIAASWTTLAPPPLAGFWAKAPAGTSLTCRTRGVARS
jgi:hypothetical protein